MSYKFKGGIFMTLRLWSIYKSRPKNHKPHRKTLVDFYTKIEYNFLTKDSINKVNRQVPVSAKMIVKLITNKELIKITAK